MARSKEEIKRDIAAVKSLLNEIPENEVGKKIGNPNLAEIGKATRWKKGQSGNPNGPGKKRVVFWRYVCDFLSLNREIVKAMDEDDLSLAQCGARQFALAVADGRWLQTKELIDRELGRVGEAKTDNADEPKFIRLPIKVQLNESDNTHKENPI